MSKTSDKELYFVAIVPPDPLHTKVMEIKQHFENRYESRKALNSPPHITLRMPFKFREDREPRIIAALEEACHGLNSFSIDISGFGFFEPRVVYLQVLENPELNELQQKVNRMIRQKLKIINELGDRPFRPHMTVAFRDLRKPKFYEAKSKFGEREFKSSFEVTDICLLKHNGRLWEVQQRISLVRN